MTCLNCGRAGSGQFCESCGQRAELQTITMRALLHQVPKVVFDVDRGLWHTLKGLLMRPGEIINGYLDGRRIRYTNPLTLLLLFSGINTVLYTSGLLDLSQLSGTDSPQARQFANDGTRWMFQYYSLVLLLFLPVASGMSRWCFAVCGRNYAEHLVINVYITAITVAFTACMFPVLLGLSPRWIPVAWNGVFLMSGAYNVFALAKVFAAEDRSIKVTRRALAAVGLYYFFTLLAIAVPSVIYIIRSGLVRTR